MDTCLAGWNAVVNYLVGAAFGPGGSGHFPNETITDWLMNADIGTLENLMQSYGIDYGYTYTPPPGYTMPLPSGATDLKSPAARAGLCQHWQTCYTPPSEYSTVSLNPAIGVRLAWDRWNNVYVYLFLSTSPGISVTVGNIRIRDEAEWKEIESLAADQQELATQTFLRGKSDGTCLSGGVGACLAQNGSDSYALEGGFAFAPALSMEMSVGGMLYDAGSPKPWAWQRWFR